MFAEYDRRTERWESVAVAVFEQHFPTQVEVGDGADVRVDADKEGLGAVLILCDIRLELYALHKIGCGIGHIDEHICQGHAGGVALARRGRVARLELRDDVNADDKDSGEEDKAGDEENACGFHSWTR